MTSTTPVRARPQATTDVAALVERRARRPPAGVGRSTPARPSSTSTSAAVLRAHLALRRDRGRGARAGRLHHRRHRPLLRDRAPRRRRGGARAAQRVPPPGLAHPHRARGLGRQHRVRLPPVDLRHRRVAAARRRPAAGLRQELLRPASRCTSACVAGLVFVCLADEPPDDFDEVVATVVAVRAAPPAAPHQGRCAGRPGRGGELEAGDGEQPGVLPLRGRPPRADLHLLPDLRLRARTRSRRGCGPRTSATSRPRRSWSRPARARSALPRRSRSSTAGCPAFRVQREALDGAGESYTARRPAASRRLLGDLDTPRLGRVSLHTQPNAWFHLLADHAVTFACCRSRRTGRWCGPPGWCTRTRWRASTTTSTPSPTCGARPTSRTASSARAPSSG